MSLLRQIGRSLQRLGVSLRGGFVGHELTFDTTKLPYKGKQPNISPAAFVSGSAAVAGEVKIGEKSSVWHGAVLRGDVNYIEVGKNVHLEDNVVVHVARHGIKKFVSPSTIGDNVLVGANTLVHAATIQGNTIVGVNCTILDGSVIEKNSILASGSLVAPGKVVKSGQLWAGAPAKFVRNLTEEEIKAIPSKVAAVQQLATAAAIESSKSPEEIIDDERFRQIEQFSEYSIAPPARPGRVYIPDYAKES
eukprot:TRINITY_DN535_c0_g1_i1.p1 TRINITY_DN535_c0_g1~~TRINITY_DN535_c0_g1_i1.p1  ORF type:complete len:249 (+),score=92.21 TRINITY_DN535_c0_g1_i1:58-804(+)